MKSIRLIPVFLCITLIAPILSAGCPPPRKQPPVLDLPAEKKLSVMTYNINWGGPGAELTLAAINKADADIVCLQEITPEWEKLIHAELSGKYAYMRFWHGRGAGGIAILSRHNIENAKLIPPKSGWFPAILFTVKTKIGLIQMLGLHLRPPLSEGGGFRVKSYFGTKKIRLSEITEFYENIDASLPTIILGDFNENDSGSAVGWAKKQGFSDALLKFDRHSNTWRWKTRVIKLKSRLDHILYSGELECLSARVANEGASDHLPVIAIFGLSAKK